MVKALDAPYEAGRRGAGWIKVKRADTLDLVVLAAEWGHGRRQGWLSNLHLGARDPATGGFVMLGKTFKGMTDEMLDWQTERFQELETSRDGITVYVRPEIVVEVAFDGLQPSTRYPGGLALRFARVKGYRPDKRADEADTIETVRAIHERSAGWGAGRAEDERRSPRVSPERRAGSRCCSSTPAVRTGRSGTTAPGRCRRASTSRARIRSRPRSVGIRRGARERASGSLPMPCRWESFGNPAGRS